MNNLTNNIFLNFIIHKKTNQLKRIPKKISFFAVRYVLIEQVLCETLKYKHTLQITK